VARINMRLQRVENTGNLGDAHSVGDGVSELRIQYGPGYRLYFILEEQAVIVLLCGGDKDSQQRDIARAKQIANDWRQGNA
jgi:putative addiction module killer protein